MLSATDNPRADMIRKALLVVSSLGVALVVFASIMYVTNPAPIVPAIPAVEAANPERPFVVKLHARWCPVCMATKGIWSRIQATYASRVNLLVLDFTDQANTAASRAEARRLGLEKIFDEYLGATGTILVLNGRTREVAASIHGSRDFAEYRAAIDRTLSGRD